MTEREKVITLLFALSCYSLSLTHFSVCLPPHKPSISPCTPLLTSSTGAIVCSSLASVARPLIHLVKFVRWGILLVFRVPQPVLDGERVTQQLLLILKVISLLQKVLMYKGRLTVDLPHIQVHFALLPQ